MKIYRFIILFIIGCNSLELDTDYVKIKKLTKSDLKQDLIIFFNPDGCSNCIDRLDELLFKNSFNHDLMLIMVSRNSKPYIDKYSDISDTIIVDSELKSIKLNLYDELPVIYKIRDTEVKKIELNLTEDFLNQVNDHDIF